MAAGKSAALRREHAERGPGVGPYPRQSLDGQIAGRQKRGHRLFRHGPETLQLRRLSLEINHAVRLDPFALALPGEAARPVLVRSGAKIVPQTLLEAVDRRAGLVVHRGLALARGGYREQKQRERPALAERQQHVRLRLRRQRASGENRVRRYGRRALRDLRQRPRRPAQRPERRQRIGLAIGQRREQRQGRIGAFGFLNVDPHHCAPRSSVLLALSSAIASRFRPSPSSTAAT